MSVVVVVDAALEPQLVEAAHAAAVQATPIAGPAPAAAAAFAAVGEGFAEEVHVGLSGTIVAPAVVAVAAVVVAAAAVVVAAAVGKSAVGDERNSVAETAIPAGVNDCDYFAVSGVLPKARAGVL